MIEKTKLNNLATSFFSAEFEGGGVNGDTPRDEMLYDEAGGIIDNSKIKASRSHLNFECGQGNAAINLHGGKIIFTSGGLTVGHGLLGLTLAHVYNSRFDETLIPNKKTFAGKGWKLNVQQYILRDGDGYLYIDAMGDKHTFNPVSPHKGPNYHHYYCPDLGLTFYNTGTLKYIFNEAGDKMLFDALGRLTSTLSCHSSSFRQSLEYDTEGKLISVSVSNGGSVKHRLNLDYDNDNRLQFISHSDSGLAALGCIYDNLGNLSGTWKTLDSALRLDLAFGYDSDGKILYAVDAESKAALRFNHSGNYVNKVTEGKAQVQSTDSSALVLYPGDDIFVGGDTFLGSPFPGLVTSLDITGFEEKTSHEIGIQIAGGNVVSAVVKDSYTNFSMEYFFNSIGAITSVLQKMSNSDYRTLSKDSGVPLYLAGASGMGVNGSGMLHFFAGTEIPLTANTVTNLASFNGKTVDVSFFAKHTCASGSAYVLFDLYGNGSKKQSFAVGLNYSAPNAWQQASAQIKIGSDNIDEVKLTFVREDHQSMWMSNIRVAEADSSASSTICKFHDINLNEYKHFKVTTRYHDVVTVTEKDISEEMFFTPSDLMMTCKNQFKGGQDEFTAVCCGGTKKIENVTKLELSSKQPFWKQLEIYGTPPTFAEAVIHEEIVFLDGRKIFIYNSFHEDGCLTYREYQKPGAANSYESVFTDWKGLTRYTVDVYGVKTEYTYRNGEVQTTTVTGTDGKKLVHENSYDHLQAMTKTTGGNVVQNFSYNYPQGTLAKSWLSDPSTGKLTGAEYKNTYDFAHEMLTHVSAGAGTNNLQHHTLEYDQGALSAVRNSADASTPLHGFAYTDDSVTIYGNGVLRQKVETDETLKDSQQKIISTQKFYKTPSVSADIVTETDVCGRLLTVKDYTGSAAKTVANTYEQGNESVFASRLTKTSDPYDGTIHAYAYKNNSLTNSSGGGVSISVVDTKNPYFNKLYYSLYNDANNVEEEYYYDEAYDENKGSSPRLNKTVYKTNNSELFGATYEYDGLGRLFKVRNGLGFCEYYFHPSGSQATMQPAGTIMSDGDGCSYTYDERGNIKTALTNSKASNYTYDSLNRLKTENFNFGIAKNYTYEYNEHGQLEKVLNHGSIEKLFEYDTNGRLISSVIGGATKAYAYDSYGNPVSIGGVTTTWERGTLLKSFSEYVSYSYNHKGVRFAKTNGQRSINYYLDGTKILGEDHNDGKRIRYFYDITGLAGFTLNEVKYHYVKDLQGNIVRIHNASGQLVCKYYYDAWGNTTIHDENGNVITNNLANADHVAIINPFRYRSYYYDNETGYYYLLTRYYDPNIGRFISPDTIDYLDPTDINGLDLYCYCVNNPVMYVDPSGHIVITSALIGWGIFAIFSLLSVYVIESQTHIIENTLRLAIDVTITLGGIAGSFLINAGSSIIGWFDNLFYIDNPDPYGRPGQKKQGRERKTGARKKDGWEDRSGRRNGGPRPPKKHTPGRGHKKYIFWLIEMFRRLIDNDEWEYLD